MVFAMTNPALPDEMVIKKPRKAGLSLKYETAGLALIRYDPVSQA